MAFADACSFTSPVPLTSFFCSVFCIKKGCEMRQLLLLYPTGFRMIRLPPFEISESKPFVRSKFES
jgi:hypothetical protein